MTKLNHTAAGSGKEEGEQVEIACYLGSAQHSLAVEEAALQGLYRLVYVTPEKATTSSFLSGLTSLYKQVFFGAFRVSVWVGF